MSMAGEGLVPTGRPVHAEAIGVHDVGIKSLSTSLMSVKMGGETFMTDSTAGTRSEVEGEMIPSQGSFGDDSARQRAL